MARTISQIKDSICEEFMKSETMAAKYGFEVGDSFASTFSTVSVESILFYIVAVAVWTLECLFDRHKAEVQERIDTMAVRRPKWYRDKTLAFMKDHTLKEDSDTYDTSDMSEDDIAAARVVKYAAATESSDASLLTIKVAGGTDDNRQPLDDETQTQLMAYLSEIKDAGVRIEVVNQQADDFICDVEIYYDAISTENDMREKCEEAIKSYIANLPFNGEYSNMALVDALQAVDSVKVVNFKSASARVSVSGDTAYSAIDAIYRPASGYMKPEEKGINLIMKAYGSNV